MLREPGINETDDLEKDDILKGRTHGLISGKRCVALVSDNIIDWPDCS